ncbi:MAG TPA: SDR family oxidoreductase [Methylomirabilota bacterium]|nr:SDR family oxidoreductase [Methylomirabilota bacterium]
MTAYERLESELRTRPRHWLVTGAAGFIGSHLIEALLRLDQRVRGLDNFLTGREENLEQVRALVSPAQWSRLEFIRADIRDAAACRAAAAGVDHILHQAALGSVPQSLEDPATTDAINVGGTVNMLVAARDNRVRSFVYASSCAIYGDDPGLPKHEEVFGAALSPYAVSKLADELYAGVFHRCYGLEAVGLRYFNVYGPRQDPNGPYAAVIPKWIDALIGGEPVRINGDGETSRDFCYVANVVQANLLAATASPGPEGEAPRVYNVAVGERTTLNQLFQCLRDLLAPRFPEVASRRAEYGDFRPGDVRHSLADISRARERLGYQPTHRTAEGLARTVEWHLARRARLASR